MSTLAQLRTARDAAVTDYASKVEAMRLAYVELAALDQALASERVASAPDARPGFGPPPDVIPLRHTYAAPNFGAGASDPALAIRARVTAILAAFPTADP